MTDIHVFTMDNRFAFNSQLDGLRECLKRFGSEVAENTGDSLNRADIQWWLTNRQIRHMCTALACLPDETIVGTASWFIEPKLIHGGSFVGHIEDVAVRAGYEGNGVGRAVVEYATERCRAAGCYKVILDCSERNAAFYEKLGFRKHEMCMRLDLKS